jgi:hypothetical protein
MPRYLGFALTAIVACGGDDVTTGPAGSISVGGTWSASVSNMTGGGASCRTTSPIQVTLRQTESTFSGSYAGGILTCLTPTESFSSAVGTGTVKNGKVSGKSVSFDLDTPAFHHSGSVSGVTMSGTAEWTYDFGLPMGEVTLVGSWSAAKQ